MRDKEEIMGKTTSFQTYFEMSCDDIPAYVLEKTPDIGWDRDTITAEVPKEHGNINYVYRVWDAKGHHVYVKQAGLQTRISKDMSPSKTRNQLESQLLSIEDKLAPGMVPHMYCYDTTMCACIMEDCSNFEVMRDAMLEHKTFPRFADDITTFMVNTLLPTSDVCLDHIKKKKLQKQFISPDLCDITEKLVLMEPYGDQHHRNNVFAPNKEFVERELYTDDALHLAVAKLKFKFMTDAQALIHGDLHTGSIFVTQDATKAFDCEFGTFAPMGYDVGNVIANIIFAFDNGYAAGDTDFCQWCLTTIEQIVDMFTEKFQAKWDACVTEPMARVPGFKQWYLSDVMRDTAGYTGTELHRRTVGMANVVDVTSIQDTHKRMVAERTNIYVGKDVILHQEAFTTGADYVRAIKQGLAKAKDSVAKDAQ